MFARAFLVVAALQLPACTPLAAEESEDGTHVRFAPIQEGPAAGGAGPPNIVLLFADDQRADTIAAWGNAFIETPALDRLVDEGFSFRSAYCLGSPHGAVCMPSRAMLHTGWAYIGMDLSTFDERPTLGGLLGQAGYRTFATGKWHNGQETLARSFQSGRAILMGGMSDHHDVPLVDLEGGELVGARRGDAHSSTLFADAALGFLEEAGHGGPFFLYVAFTAPHDPRDPPPERRVFEPEERPPLPQNFRPQHGFDNGFLTVRDEQLAPWPRSPEVVRDQLAEYYALIEHLDHEIARILDRLDEQGLENTIVVYAADHGLALGSHGLLGKQSVYEHSLRAPLVVRGPGIPAGGSSSALVYLHDLFPTLLGLAGLEPQPTNSSADLAPVWRGDRTSLRDSLFLSMGRTQRAVTDGRWKLIRYPSIDRLQLFDLASDPWELHDLASAAEAGERVPELRSTLEEWQARLGDDVPWRADPLVPREVDLTDRARIPDRWQPAWIREKYFGE